jgi:hypothetical protein
MTTSIKSFLHDNAVSLFEPVVTGQIEEREIEGNAIFSLYAVNKSQWNGTD